MEYRYYTLRMGVFSLWVTVLSLRTQTDEDWQMLRRQCADMGSPAAWAALQRSTWLIKFLIGSSSNSRNFLFSGGDSEIRARGAAGMTDLPRDWQKSWKTERIKSCLKPWTWPPWVRCYCPVGMNGDDRWAGRGWVGIGRRLSDSSRVELEGVVGWGAGGGGAGWTNGVLLPLSSEGLRRRQSYDRRGSMGATSGMFFLQRETLSRCERTTGQITTDMSAIFHAAWYKSPTAQLVQNI